MIGALLIGALALPDDVGAPPPGDFTVMLGIGHDRRSHLEVRTGLLRWLGLRTFGELTAESPRFGGALRIAAADGRRQGLFAHTELGGSVRARFDRSVVSGFDLDMVVGLLGRWGPVFLRFDGGLAYGFAVEPIHGEVTDAIDQQGGLFTTQRLTLGIDFGTSFRIDTYAHFAVPSSAFFAASPESEALRTTDALLGLRLGVRF